MTLRHDFLAFTAGAVAARTVLPMAAKAESVPHLYPDTLFPPGHHSRLNPHPDAALLAACNDYLRIQQEFEAHFADLPVDVEDDDAARAILAPLAGLTETIVRLRATTADGHMARARCVAFHYLPNRSACQDDPDGAREELLKAAMMRDLVLDERVGA